MKGLPVIKTCPHCNQEFDARAKNQGRGIKRMMSQVYCSRKCSKQAWGKEHRESAHHMWKGGVFADNGYRRLNTGKVNGVRKSPGMHRIIAEAHLGRKLLPNEVVHHKDRNRSNNSIDNLQVMTRSEHTKLHHSLGHLNHV